jgi:hypothetical protein
MALIPALLLLIWVMASIFLNGMALTHYMTRLRGLELVGYGAAAGVVLHAFIGWAIAAVPSARIYAVAILIALTLLSGVYFLARRVAQEVFPALSISSKIGLGLWALFLVASLALLKVDVTFPESLPDGLYISKAHTLNVKIQYLTSLPADNFIPFAVAEFFLRGVSFKKQRPILPGQEVTNRTILMSLVAIPFRAALDAPRDHPRLGTYHYIGQNWPDVWTLDRENAFEQFTVIGTALNSLMLLGLFLFLLERWRKCRSPAGSTALYQ